MNRETTIASVTAVIAYLVALGINPWVSTFTTRHIYSGSAPAHLPVFAFLLAALAAVTLIAFRTQWAATSSAMLLLIGFSYLITGPNRCEGDLPLMLVPSLLAYGKTRQNQRILQTGIVLLALFVTLEAAPSPIGTPFLSIR